MGHASDESASDFQAWLDANELRAPKDFKFAFTSAHKAAEACHVAPQTASDAWTSISHTEVEVPSSWALWVKSHHDAKGRVSAKPQDGKPTFKIWRGLQHRKNRRDQGPANDAIQRQAAAKDVIRIALSWKERGRLAVSGVRYTPPGVMRGLICRLPALLLPTQTRFAQLYAHGSTGALGARHTQRIPLIRRTRRLRPFFMPLLRQVNRRESQGQRLQRASTICAGLRHVQGHQCAYRPLIGRQGTQLMEASPQSREQRRTPRYTSASTVC